MKGYSAIAGTYEEVRLFEPSDNTGQAEMQPVMAEYLDIRPQSLSEVICKMESDGIVTRRQYEEIPPRVEYALTKRGRQLWPVLHRLARWATGEEYDGDGAL